MGFCKDTWGHFQSFAWRQNRAFSQDTWLHLKLFWWHEKQLFYEGDPQKFPSTFVATTTDYFLQKVGPSSSESIEIQDFFVHKSKQIISTAFEKFDQNKHKLHHKETFSLNSSVPLPETYLIKHLFWRLARDQTYEGDEMSRDAAFMTLPLWVCRCCLPHQSRFSALWYRRNPPLVTSQGGRPQSCWHALRNYSLMPITPAFQSTNRANSAR